MFPRQGIDRFGPYSPPPSSLQGRHAPRTIGIPVLPMELAMLLRLSAVVAAMTVVSAIVLCA
ncbi:MAG TPA: hypothetical protein VNS34_25285 [Rhizobiaceae bacterium]|nr:hypothetical protein [Rhizobiaceae bacterium]